MTAARRWGLFGALALVVAIVAALVLLLRDGGATDPTDRAAPPTAEPESPEPGAAPSPGPTESLDEQIQRVTAVVEEVRELTFDEAPEATIVATDELAERVAEEVSSYAVEDAELDGRLLTLLGAVAPGTDLRELLVTAYSEQVAGYYDDETGELVVGATDDGRRLGRLDEVILAHELQHALADQALGLPEVEDLGEGREDEVLARMSLVEGDATMTMQRYVEQGLSAVDQLLIAQEAAERQSQLGDLTALPPYLQGSIEFPYTYGAGFVAALLEEDGWAAVDAAYASPPVSTAQILFPERYLAGETPRTPPSTGSPTGGWERARTYAFGAADLLLLFGAPGGEPARALADARRAAAAWEGGEVHLWTSGDDSAAAVGLTGAELCDPVDRWYAASFPSASRTSEDGAVVFEHDGRTAVLRCDDDAVRLGIGPDREVAAALVTG